MPIWELQFDYKHELHRGILTLDFFLDFFFVISRAVATLALITTLVAPHDAHGHQLGILDCLNHV